VKVTLELDGADWRGYKMSLTKTEVRILLEELLRSEEPTSEMQQFSSSGPGKKVMKAGAKIMSAGKAINALAYEQTGAMRGTLGNISEFVYKLGEALASINTMEEGESMSSKLPTTSELKKLQKSIMKLERL